MAIGKIASFLGLLAATVLANVSYAKHEANADAAQVVKTFHGPDGIWDYISIDSAERLLLIGRGDGVTTLDLKTSKIMPRVIHGRWVHSVVPLPDSRAMAMSGWDHEAVIFNVRSGQIYSRTNTGGHPDAAILEPTSHLVFVANKESASVAIIDPKTGRRVASISVGGDLEFIAADGRGNVYVNVSSKNELAVIDVARRSVTKRLPLPGCEGPTGLAIDPQTRMLASACENDVAVLMKTDGSDARTLAIGSGPDGVTLDRKFKRFVIPCGKDGVIAVLAENATKQGGVHLVQGLKGARSGAFDPKSGLFYVAKADFEPTGKKPEKAIRGTFRIYGLRIPFQ